MITSVLAVVPLLCDDQDAPGGCAALRELRGLSLVARVVGMLARTGRVGHVIVSAPPSLIATLAAGLAADADLAVDAGSAVDRVIGPVVDVIPVAADDAGGQLLAVLEQEQAETVVVHDALYPLAPAALTVTVLDALAAAPGAVAAVPLGPVTDTLKWVDERDVVTGTADREQYRTVHVPQAYRVPALRAALAGAPLRTLRRPGPQVLPELVRGAGGHVVSVPAPAEARRIASSGDLVLADALIGAGAADAGQGVAGRPRAASSRSASSTSLA